MDMYKLKFTTLALELFSFLSIRAGEKFSQRDLAKALHVSPTAIASALKLLAREQFVTITKTKTINFIMFNRDNPKAVHLKRTENLKNIYISGLADFLENQLPGSTILVFGSYAKGEDTQTSDIDIAVIGRKEKSLALQPFEKTLSRTINVNFYDSWKNIHQHLKNNILNGIVICGSVDL